MSDTAVLDSPAPVAQRKFCQISQRRTPDGRVVHVKRYMPKEGERDAQHVERIVAREVQLLQRLARIPSFQGDIAPMRLAEFDLATTTLTLENAPGSILQDLLFRYRQYATLNLDHGVYAAGKWLRSLQELPVEPGDDELLCSADPPEPEEYCNIRFDRIEESVPSLRNLGVRERYLTAFPALRKACGGEFEPLVWTHGDYGPFNMMWDGSLLTAIDYEQARPGSRYHDASYFVLRLETLPWLFPWRRWPVEHWKREFLRGFNVPGVERSPEYVACRLKHLVCRLVFCARNAGQKLYQRIHARYLRRKVLAAINVTLAGIA